MDKTILKVGDWVRFKAGRCGRGIGGSGPELHFETSYEVVQAFDYARERIVSVVSSNGVVFCFAHPHPDSPVSVVE